ncbi:MAG: hypothetical protein CH6_3227 [Candidatus Kapaibacterium sp.]|nr:MAG: hypothetical protein CH6_3227 [Candidatus Kapabacteria bacterium]
MDTNNIKNTLIKRLTFLRKAYESNLKLVVDTFDDEAIHDLRVSLRRIQALVSYIDEICNENISLNLLKDIKIRIKKFNKLRDTQVQIQFLIKQIKKFTEIVDLLVFLKKSEKKQIKKLKKALNLPDFDLSGDFFFYQTKLQQTSCLNLIQMDDIIKNAQNSLNELKTFIAMVEKGKYETYHKTRIKLKKFRYIIETIEEIILSPNEKLKKVQNLQTILGEIQDFTVLLSLIDNFCQRENIEVSKFADFVEFVQQKREEKEQEFWNNIEILEFWDNFLMNY